jgi:hypothetical protein
VCAFPGSLGWRRCPVQYACLDIGSHRLTFAPLSNGLDIRTAVRIAVSLGQITLFRYQLDGVEQWRYGPVVRLATQTTDAGNAGIDAGSARSARAVGVRHQGPIPCRRLHRPDGEFPANRDRRGRPARGGGEGRLG